MEEYSLVENESNDGSIETGEATDKNLQKKRLPNTVSRCSAINCCLKLRNRFVSFCLDCCGISTEESLDHEITSVTLGKKYLLGFLEVAFAFNYCYWFQVIIHNKFCNFLFKCGCTWDFDGGWKDCNVHNKTGGPKCPWCMARATVSWTTDYLLTILMIITYLYLLSNRKKLIGHPLFRLFAPIMIYFISGIIVGMCFLGGGYPYFIF